MAFTVDHVQERMDQVIARMDHLIARMVALVSRMDQLMVKFDELTVDVRRIRVDVVDLKGDAFEQRFRTDALAYLGRPVLPVVVGRSASPAAMTLAAERGATHLVVQRRESA